nr:MAG TPA: coiled-coil domain-containing protein [Caudoviricetes sp.]
MYNKDYLLSLRGKQRREMYKQLVPFANKQKARIEEQGLEKESVLNVLHKRTNWNIDKYNSRAYLKLVRFVTARSHTLTGIKEIRQERTQALRDMGISENLLNEADFYTFLHSQEYKSLKMRNPSEDIIEIYDLLFSQGKSHTEIQHELQEYSSTTHVYVKGKALW